MTNDLIAGAEALDPVRDVASLARGIFEPAAIIDGNDLVEFSTQCAIDIGFLRAVLFAARIGKR